MFSSQLFSECLFSLGITAAKFLKKSGLKESLLHKIWSLSDYDTSGTLDKKGEKSRRSVPGKKSSEKCLNPSEMNDV